MFFFAHCTFCLLAVHERGHILPVGEQEGQSKARSCPDSAALRQDVLCEKTLYGLPHEDHTPAGPLPRLYHKVQAIIYHLKCLGLPLL